MLAGPPAAEVFAKVDAGRHLLAAGCQPAEVIEQSIAARTGGSPPSGPRAWAFQRQVLTELSALTDAKVS